MICFQWAMGKLLGIAYRQASRSPVIEACPGLRETLAPNWRGDVCCRVLTGGGIRGDAPIRLLNPKTEDTSEQT